MKFTQKKKKAAPTVSTHVAKKQQAPKRKSTLSFGSLFKKKKKNTQPTKTAENTMNDAITSKISTDIFGRKTKTSNTHVLLLDDYLLTWRQELISHSRNIFWIYSAVITLFIFLGMAILSSPWSIIFFGLFGAILIILAYLLLDVKMKYITGISNALQIPTFNKLIQQVENDMADGASDLSDVTNRSSYRRYKSYIMLYLSASHKETDLQTFVNYTKTLPKQLIRQVAISMNNQFTNVANSLYNTDKIKAIRPTESNLLNEALRDEKNQMIGKSLVSIARDGKPKRGGRAKNVQEAIHELELMKESKEFVKGSQFRSTAPWYFKLFSTEQIDNMLEMNMTPKAMTKWQINRISKSVMLPIFVAIVVGVSMLLKNKVPQLAVVANPFYILGGILLGFAYFQFQAKEITSALKSWRFKRDMAFSQMTQIIVPYLFLMKAHGGSLIEVFDNVAQRLESPNDRALVVRLIRDIREYPNEDIPFINFAQSFTTDPSAVVFMTAVNRSAQSKGNNDVIEDLAERAQNELLEKVRQISQVKEARMTILPTYVTIIGMIINLIMVMSAMLNQMSAAMG